MKKKVIKRIEGLRRKRKELLSLPPEKAFREILNARQPAAIIHSFPEEDLFFLIQDIGLTDSIPILSLASDRQWEYFLDIEVWQRDRIDLLALTKWLNLLLKADTFRFVRWALKEDHMEVIKFYMYHNIEVIVRPHDLDPGNFKGGYLTLDDVFYFKIKEYQAVQDDKSKEEHEWLYEKQRRFINTFLKNLAAFSHSTYQHFLLEVSSLIPSDSEESSYRLRNIRLAEKGFLPFEEAVSVYRPISVDALTEDRLKIQKSSREPDRRLPVPHCHRKMLDPGNLFSNALEIIKNNPVTHEIQLEFAALCNQIIVADHMRIETREDLKKVVTKASGYINMGLENPSGCTKDQDLKYAANLLKNFSLSEIFKVGYGIGLKLKWKAEEWYKKSWFLTQNMSLNFWGEDGLGVLGGLMIKKPMYYDSTRAENNYRDFSSSRDIAETKKRFNTIMAFDFLLSRLQINLKIYSNYGLITYKNLLLTYWVRYFLGLGNELTPLKLEEFQKFYANLWENETKPFKVKLAMKESFVGWLSERSGLKEIELNEKLGGEFERLFKEIESELGYIESKDLDPRYIHLFLISSR